MLEVQWCKLFRDTFAEKARTNADLTAALNEFIQTKIENPNKPFGSRDASFSSAGHFGKRVSKIRHAHLMHDLNLCYTISDKDPTIIKLYGVFKHDELGTGQPANTRRQESVATTMSNQNFEPMPIATKKPEPKKADDYKQSAWYKNQNK